VTAESVRTTVDIPVALYRKLKQQAAAHGQSVRELILAGIRNSLLFPRKPKRRRVHFPLIKATGHTIHLTNEQIYEYVEFP
jgi:hypothetical protein